VLLPPSDAGGFSPLDVARATHAALHAELSPLPFEPGQLRPIQRALTAVLEDARVEARALAEFPGLRAVWAPFHVASAADGETAPALLGRLARALFDSQYADPNGWIQRARAAWNATDPCDAASSRALGSVLGNDLGQMRVPFDPAAPTLEPSYRDDHTGLWRSEPRTARETEDRADEARREGSSGAGSGEAPDVGAPPPVTHRYPEWDYVIARERPEHCAIRELARTPTSAAAVPAGVARRTRAALVRAHRRCSPRRRSPEGAELDLSAVVREAAERARGGGGDGRLYRGRARRRTRSSTLLLLDLSASVQQRELSLLRGISTLLAGSHPEGAELAVHGFSSRGREDVLYEKFKAFDAPPTPLAPYPGRSGSTRLGAALRHAAALLVERRAAYRLLLVVTDGEPADVDVFDARYLTEDARRACSEARRRGARVLALCLGARPEGSQRRIFDAPGIRGALAVRRLEDLPRSVLRAYSPRRSSPGDGSRV
jgi:Mg-chelatase subunit ChlD